MINIKKYKFNEIDSKFINNKEIENSASQSTPKKLINGVIVRSKSKKELDILYTGYCKDINKKFDRLSKSNPNKYDHNERIRALKRCEKCQDFINSNMTILCDICDDAYHIYCLGVKTVPKGNFECPKCVKDRQVTYKQSTLEHNFNINIKFVAKVIY
jgi:hypothetical protein